MTIKELRDYLNSLGSELDNIQVKLEGVRSNKDYQDMEISTLDQTKHQLLKYGLLFEVAGMDVYEILMPLDIDTMLDIEENSYLI